MDSLSAFLCGLAAGAALTAVGMYAARGRYVKFLESSNVQLARENQRHMDRAFEQNVRINELNARIKEDIDSADWWKKETPE